jgi:hypothetical protein
MMVKKNIDARIITQVNELLLYPCIKITTTKAAFTPAIPRAIGVLHMPKLWNPAKIVTIVKNISIPNVAKYNDSGAG